MIKILYKNDLFKFANKVHRVNFVYDNIKILDDIIYILSILYADNLEDYFFKVDILYSRYYWLSRYCNLYISIYGTESDVIEMKYQVIKELEYLGGADIFNIEMLEKLDNGEVDI